MAGRIVASGLGATAGAIVVVAVGARLYGFQVIWAGVPAVLATFAVAMFCFCSLGLVASVLVPWADSAVPIAWGTMLPLRFISDVYPPIDNAPHWRRATTSLDPRERSPTMSNRRSTRSPERARSTRPMSS